MLLLSSLMIARVLGVEVYGEYGIIRSTVNMFAVFAGFGLGLTATKHISEFRISDPIRAGRIMTLTNLFALVTGGMVASGIYIAAPWIAAETINAPHLFLELRICAIILFLSALNGAQTGALAGFEAFKSIARVNLCVGLASFPLLVTGAFWAGLRGAILALATTIAINCWLNHRALCIESLRCGVPLFVKDCLIEWPILWKYSLPAAASGVMVGPVFWACNAILVNQPNGYKEMGIFDVANQWRMAILFVPGMVAQIALPMLSSLNSLDDQVRYRKVLKWNVLINGGVALAISVPVLLLSPWIMASYGKGFEGGVGVIVVLILSSVPMAITTVIGKGIASKGRMWMGLFLNLAWAMVLFSLCWIFIHKGYGALGLALGNIFAYSFHILWQTFYLRKLLKPHHVLSKY
jgi:O-antigen/teichoic acid export membrane protein